MTLKEFREKEEQKQRRMKQLGDLCRTPDIALAQDKSIGELKLGIVYTTRSLIVTAGRLKQLAIEYLHRTGEDGAVKLLADVTKMTQKTWRRYAATSCSRTCGGRSWRTATRRKTIKTTHDNHERTEHRRPAQTAQG